MKKGFNNQNSFDAKPAAGKTGTQPLQDTARDGQRTDRGPGSPGGRLGPGQPDGRPLDLALAAAQLQQAQAELLTLTVAEGCREVERQHRRAQLARESREVAGLGIFALVMVAGLIAFILGMSALSSRIMPPL